MRPGRRSGRSRGCAGGHRPRRRRGRARPRRCRGSASGRSRPARPAGHGEDADRHEAHMGDRRIGDQLLHVLLRQRDQRGVDHRDDRQARRSAA